MYNTPWSQYGSTTPAEFRFEMIAATDEDDSFDQNLLVTVHYAEFRLKVAASQHANVIAISDPRRSEMQAEPVYALQLSPYQIKREKPPQLLLHPVALAHAYAAGQVPLGFVEHLARLSLAPVLHAQSVLEVPCPLLEALQVPSMWFTFLYHVRLRTALKPRMECRWFGTPLVVSRIARERQWS